VAGPPTKRVMPQSVCLRMMRWNSLAPPGIAPERSAGPARHLRAERRVRSRLNGLYMATFFVGGAAGSALGGWAYAHGGRSLTTWAGLGLPILALARFLIERPETYPDGDTP
jgi:predicted MFS family arabinose efflux permease